MTPRGNSGSEGRSTCKDVGNEINERLGTDFQLALTNVYAKRPKRGALATAPIGLAKIGVKKARGKDYVVTGAQMEAELRDASTGEIIGAILATELAAPGADEMTWEQILEMLDRYAVRLASNF